MHGVECSVFLFDDRPAGSAILIPQTSHAWLAWQLAEHWGNRRFPAPSPRAEVLAAVLLHDSGWADFDADPGVDGSGRPRTFDRMPAVEHLAIWRASVRQAAAHARYAGLMVSSHFDRLAARKTRDLLASGDTVTARAAESFRAEMQREQAAWREEMAVDARYRPFLDGRGWAINQGLLAACDLVAVHLCAVLPVPFEAPAVDATGQTEVVVFEPAGDRTLAVRPWPLKGDRVRLQAEGRRVPTTHFGSGVELREVLQRAPVERLTFTLVRPSAQG
jgi:predicted HD phosphohydrolase